MTAQASEQTLVRYRRSPLPRNDFELVIPSTWRAVRVPCDPPTGPRAVRMALFVRGVGEGAALEVRCCSLGREVDPLDQMAAHLARNGATVLKRQPRYTAAGTVGTLRVERRTTDDTLVTIARVIKDAELLYFVYAHTTLADFSALEGELDAMVASVRLPNAKRGRAEPWRHAGGRFPADHLFFYPESFKIEREPDASPVVATYVLQHTSLTEQAGRIAFVAIARPRDSEDPSPHAAWLRRSFGRVGVELGAVVLERERGTGPVDLPTWRARSEGHVRGTPAETELLVVRHEDAFILVARAVPAGREFEAGWLANRRAFAIVCEGMRIGRRPG